MRFNHWVLAVRFGMSFLLVALCCVSGVLAQNEPAKPDAQPAKDAADEPLKKFEEMPVPTVEDLLSKPPVDWLVLKPPRRGEVLVVQPVAPRPDTIGRMAKQLEELNSTAKRPKKEEGESDDQYKQRLRDLKDEAENILVLLPLPPGGEKGDASEYRLNVSRNIERIVYHEDLMLMRADLLMNEGKLSQAFELLLALERTTSQWPGYADRRNRLIFEEAKQQAGSGNVEAAFAYFEELHSIDSKYAGLKEELGNAANKLIETAESKGESLQARFYLSRLAKRDPSHPVTQKWTAEFVKRVEALMDEARKLREQGKHSEALGTIEKATRVWPSHPPLKAMHRSIANRYQTLHVGVTRFPDDPTPYHLESADDRRFNSLTAVELFEVNRMERTPQYQSRFIEEWVPTDLGRQIVFSLRPRRAIWEASPNLTAAEVVQSLGDRLDPASRYYDERLSNYVRSLTVKSPYEFVVNLSTIPSRPQAVFRFPIRTRNPQQDSKFLGADIVSARFKIVDRTEDRTVYRRANAEPDTSSQFHVAEVIERKYPNAEKVLQALLSGDISVYAQPPIWLADRIAAGTEFNVEPMAVPTTHLLQFNSRSEPLKNNEFRRAVAYATNAERVFKEVVFRGGPSLRGRLTSAPFSTKSYAYNTAVEPHKYDLPLAAALTSVSKKRLGGTIPELTMLCEPDETALLCAKEFVKDWGRIGIKVNLITEPDAKHPENWDIVYRTVSMREPATELWPFLTMSPDARVRELEHLPDWLRQQLIELEQSPDLTSAIELLRRLHYRLHEFVQVVPLWEIDDVLITRRNLQAIPQQPLTPYQNVERWIIQPWYPPDIIAD